MTIRINTLSGAIGAELVGADLRRGVDDATARTMNEALLEHVVLVVRDQRLTPVELVSAMGVFGAPAKQNHSKQLLDGHPEIWVIDSRQAEVSPEGRRLIFGGNCWHTDHTNLPRPPKITALYAVKLPSSGGDTCFANAYSAYERLPDDVRSRIDPLRTVYGPDRHLRHRHEDRDAFSEPAVHPLVRTHPETGRRALYCHPLKAQCFEGMEPQPSFDLIDDLIEQAIVPEITYRHRWRLGDLALIDNRACMHLAQRDYDPDEGRVMHRLIVEGDRPF